MVKKRSRSEAVDARTMVRKLGARCDKCPLSAQSPVLGEGPLGARLAVVGESPGREESKLGRPFVGKSGEALDAYLMKVDLPRSAVFVTNAVACLTGQTKVYLADGTYERIAKLVKDDFRGSVLCLTEEGDFTSAKVIAVHRTLRAGRQLFKVTTAFAKKNCRGATGPILTEDHRVLTDQGWVEARWLNGRRIATGEYTLRNGDDIVVGMLLGDAGISRSRLNWSHVLRNRDWTEFKAKWFEGVGVSVKTQKTMKGPQRRAATFASRYFARIAAQWYRKDGKQVPASIRLTPRALAIWFMDDGCLVSFRSKGRKSRLEFATCGFNEASCRILVRELRAFGVESWALKVGKYWRVKVASGVATERLQELIAPWVVPSMQYKLLPKFQGRFQKSLYAPLATTTDFDEAIVTPVAATPSDHWVFCLSVEKHQNFFTSAAVVHNCFPPGGDYDIFVTLAKRQWKAKHGDKVPFPDPMDCCRHRLYNELRIDKCKTCGRYLGSVPDAFQCTCQKPLRITRHGPLVIVPMGNAAMESLLGFEGITKWRGSCLKRGR